MTSIKRIDVSIPVTVRKHIVDVPNLKRILREGKKTTKLTNKQISVELDRAITLVEHWFRNDNSFAIPDADIWDQLKNLLNIQTNEFDLSISEFEERPGEYDQRNRLYLTDGIAPTLTTGSEVLVITGGKDMIIDLSHWRREGQPRIYPDVAPTLTARDYKEPRLTWGENGMKKLKVNDLFCGAGGMGIGFKQVGFETAGAWDFDKYAVQAYSHNVDSVVKQADITQMNWDDMPLADVWTFGFPCQDLSIAGKQAGLFEGKRSGLFFEVMRLLDEGIESDINSLPSIIMAENVKGLKPYLNVLEDEYKKRGYKMYYTLYNSKFWGLAQNRERYFVVGVHESIDKEFKFPVQQEDYIPRLSAFLDPIVDEKYYIAEEKAAKIIEQAKEKLGIPKEQLQNIWTDKTGSAYCCDANYYKGTAPGDVGKGRRTQIVEEKTNSFRVRKLSPREYLRLQGFPETFEVVVSDSQTYKQAGNAVSVPVARAIAERIKMFLLSL